jgi:hypothetical protein
LNFLHHDLGQLPGNAVIEVSLDKAANVKLMDTPNFNSYRRGGSYEFKGGHATRSPFSLAVPHAGHWHVAIDLGGYAGTVRAAVRVFN